MADLLHGHPQEYFDSLEVPSLAKIEEIARKQEEKEREVEKKYHEPTEEQKARAAGTIQRSYRGYRARRQLSGYNLDPSTRWAEAIKEAKYRNLTTPHARQSLDTAPNSSAGPQNNSSRRNWHHVSAIARHAHGGFSESEGRGTSSSEENSEEKSPAEKARIKREKKLERDWKGKIMDLPYFLEMVDLKHRYGSNLRAYHAEWKKSDTHENYFQWLDYGEGKNVELEHCSRQRLEKEQVRYLSREERMQYLIDVDEQGRLRWHKNGERVWTTIDYRDSVEGIVPTDSKVKSYRQDEIAALEPQKSHEVNQLDGADTSSTDSISKASSNDSYDASRRYPDPPGLKRAKGPAKLVHVTPAVILNRLMRTTVKQNTWIFVVDLKMNLYIGIKQSGSFQHSSFLHGTRISAAGLIKVKNGQIRSLSPLSGHYRPPAASFRHFISSLKERNTDMSRVSISKSYAVLVGLEAYLGTKKQAKAVGEGVKLGVEKVVHPEQAKARKEKEKDTSQSAKLEEAKLRELQESRGIGKVIKEVKERVRGEEQERNVTGGPSLSSLLGSRRTKSSPPEGANGISTPDSKEEKRPSSSPTPDQPDRTIESTLAERPLQTQPSAPTSDNVKSNGAIEETESGLPLALSEEENPPTDLTKAIEPGPASRMDNITVGVPNESGENDPPQHNDTIPAG